LLRALFIWWSQRHAYMEGPRGPLLPVQPPAVLVSLLMSVGLKRKKARYTFFNWSYTSL